MKQKKLTDFPVCTENPFIDGLRTDLVKHTRYVNKFGEKNEEIWVNHSTGEAAVTVFAKKKVVDDDKFVKLFLSRLDNFFELSTAGIRVLTYVMTCMKPKDDMILFNLKACMEHTKYSSKAQIYKGLAELLKFGFIARGETEYLYYVNPLMIFNGDRIGFFEIYEKKSKHKAEQLSLPFSVDNEI